MILSDYCDITITHFMYFSTLSFAKFFKNFQSQNTVSEERTKKNGYVIDGLV